MEGNEANNNANSNPNAQNTTGQNNNTNQIKYYRNNKLNSCKRHQFTR